MENNDYLKRLEQDYKDLMTEIDREISEIETIRQHANLDIQKAKNMLNEIQELKLLNF